jgi:hypothetical protein
MELRLRTVGGVPLYIEPATRKLRAQPLREDGSLPCAKDTWQRLENTWQSLCRVPHTGKSTRRKIARQRILYRVLNIGAHGNAGKWGPQPLDADDGR